MKLSLNWLNQYLSVPVTAAEAEEVLTQVGLEVEGKETYESIPGGLKGLVIGEVLEKEKHPDADRLSVTKVSTGGPEILQIVCGAPNVAAGQKVVIATVGTVLPMNGQPLEIKKSKIRGVESQGMICAEDEIGIGHSHDGIIVLPAEAQTGTPAADYFGVVSDTVLEINITPNRSDATSHIGCARDIAAYLSARGKNIRLIKPELPEIPKASIPHPVKLKIEAAEACPRYSGLAITGITVKESPAWLRQKLEAVGLHPINNVVDVTNYVLYETGQPLHAFDLAKTRGEIAVKFLPESTPFITLDGNERKLSAADMIICNATEGMCIAGVFGGKESGVSEQTTGIFLESAWFNPSYIRKTARRHGLHTDASFRFERGTDPQGTIYAMYRAAALIAEVAGGEIASEAYDIIQQPFQPAMISLSFQKLKSLTGIDIPTDTIIHILQALECKITAQAEDHLTVEIPSFKVDVLRDVDLAEEILRVYGFEQIPITGELQYRKGFEPVDHKAGTWHKLRQALLSNGYFETLTLSFNHAADYRKLKGFDEKTLIHVKNPISVEMDVMRKTLLFSLLKVAAHNINRRETNLKLFELGRVYLNIPGKETPYTEKYMLALLHTGETGEEHWKNKPSHTGFYEIKGAVETLLQRAGVPFKPVSPAENAEGSFEYLAYSKEKTVLARIWHLTPKTLKALDIKQEIWYAELDWDEMTARMQDGHSPVKELPKYPWVRRDLALLVDRKITYREIETLAYQVDKKLLKSVNLFDVFEGKALPEGKKSYAVSFMFRSDERTLTDHEIESLMEKLVEGFTTRLGAELRK